MLENGKTTINKDGECIFGSNLKAKESTSEIDIKDHGSMESGMDMESFIMQMAPNMKDIGKIIWNKDTLFIQIKMVKLNLYCSKKTEWYVRIIQLQSRSQVKKSLQKKKLSLIFIHYA